MALPTNNNQPRVGPIVITPQGQYFDGLRNAQSEKGLRGTSTAGPTVWAPASLDGWDNRFGGTDSVQSAKRFAYSKSVQAQAYQAQSHVGFMNIFFGGKTLDGFKPVGESVNHVPMLVIDNRDFHFGRNGAYKVVPADRFDAALTKRLDVPMPEAGSAMKAGYGSHYPPGDPHGRIVALLDRTRIVEFGADDASATVRNIGRIERLGLNGVPQKAAIGAGVLAAGAGATMLVRALND